MKHQTCQNGARWRLLSHKTHPTKIQGQDIMLRYEQQHTHKNNPKNTSDVFVILNTDANCAVFLLATRIQKKILRRVWQPLHTRPSSLHGKPVKTGSQRLETSSWGQELWIEGVPRNETDKRLTYADIRFNHHSKRLVLHQVVRQHENKSNMFSNASGMGQAMDQNKVPKSVLDRSLTASTALSLAGVAALQLLHASGTCVAYIHAVSE